MRTIAVFLLALGLTLTATSQIAAAPLAKTPTQQPAKTPVKASVKTPAKPVAKAPAPPKPAQKTVSSLYRGTVKEVYPEDLMFALKTGPGKLPYAIRLLPTTRIVSASGAPLSFEALAAGQRVSVRGKLRSRTVIQATTVTVGG